MIVSRNVTVPVKDFNRIFCKQLRHIAQFNIRLQSLSQQKIQQQIHP